MNEFQRIECTNRQSAARVVDDTLSYSDSFLDTAENGRVKDALLRKLPRLGLQLVLSSGLREHARVAMPLLAVAIRSKLTLV